jgi:DNA ligase (NAD+)
MEKVTKMQEYNRKEMYKYCATTNLNELHKLKLYLDDLYYNTGKPGLSDSLYDVIKDMLKERDPGYVPPVGAKIRENHNRVKIPYWMGSTDKITPSEKNEMDRWFVKNPCEELVISEKLDGVSGTFTCVNGVKKMYTRGDGHIGADISYLIQYIDNIPDVGEDIAVRGELIINKKVFDSKHGKTYRNARNMVSGLVGAKTVREGLSDIKFVVYEIVGDTTMSRPSKQMRRLKNLGFTIAMNEKINKTSNMDDWIALYRRFKESSYYEIDGIVAQSNVEYDRNPDGNPSYIFAFKVNSEDSIHSTTVLDIEWSVSSWGRIIPVAIIDPIELPGNTIRRVTVSNAGLMKKKMIGPGSIINVTRSKEVIPFIVSVDEPCEELKWPEIDFKWDDNNVHINVVDASPEIIANMQVKLFANFFAKMGIKHVSRATVSKLYEAGFDTLLKIIGASKKDLLTVGGFKYKSVTRIYDNIKNGLIDVKVPELMGSCGVFGYGVGRKRVISLMTDIPDLLVADKDGLKERVLEIEGFSDIMADKVIENIDNAVQFIDDISKYVSFVDDKRISDNLVGKKFCFSGFRSSDLEKNIVNRGGKTVTTVSKKTYCIIVASKEGKSTGKVAKAESFGVPVYTKDEFITKYIL